LIPFIRKISIFNEFPELIETKISYERVNFKYNESKKRRKILARELHPNGNGYVYGGFMREYPIDDRGWVKIKDFNEEELRKIIRKAIDSMS
jgi:hypothetical protein